MIKSQNILKLKNIFQKSELNEYDFSKAPNLIVKNEVHHLVTANNLNETRQWSLGQKHFLNWTKDKSVFNREYIKEGYRRYHKYFFQKKIINKNVLDIGGGWGLFRQWWHPNQTGIFMVHDPGIERFLKGPYQDHKIYYKRAFSLPMTFTQGVGEKLPYKNNVFETILIASTLDHCLQPDKVLQETHRCLKKNGILIIIQACQTSEGKKISLNFWQRIKKHQLKEFPKIGFNLLFKKDDHLHHFNRDGLESVFKKIGFQVRKSSLLNSQAGLYIFELKK